LRHRLILTKSVWASDSP